jgi:hypothetical protein
MNGMMRLWTKTLGVFFLATALTAPVWAKETALPGTLNYIEGQGSIGDLSLDAKSVGSVDLQPGQSLTTGNGRAEVLLTPGVFLRVGDNSQVKMISSNLTNTEVEITKGQATVEVAEIHKYNVLRVGEDGTTTQLQKDGLYDFDADHNQVRVLKGEAMVQDGDRTVKIKAGHELDISQTAQLKSRKFDKNSFESSELYRFSDLRSQYLAEANLDVARNYYGGQGWYGAGWYWDPFFTAYTWIPGDGIFYSPFGWGFYSPWTAYRLPVYYGYPRYIGRVHPYAGTAIARGAVGRPAVVRPAPVARSGFGVMGGGFHGSSGGFHGGGGFHR